MSTSSEGSPIPTPWPLQDPLALCSAIETGQLDHDLSTVIAAINRRTAAIAAARTASALARLAIGTRVCLDQRVKPQYLRGELATVHDFDGAGLRALEEAKARIEAQGDRLELHGEKGVVRTVFEIFGRLDMLSD